MELSRRTRERNRERRQWIIVISKRKRNDGGQERERKKDNLEIWLKTKQGEGAQRRNDVRSPFVVMNGTMQRQTFWSSVLQAYSNL